MTHGSNGGPPDIPLTPKTKLECIRAIVERTDLSSPQKCIGVGIVLNADKDWKAEVKTAELQLYASAKDRETVFRATRVLDDKAIVSKDNTRGQSGKFTVLPPKVIDAVMEAYYDLKTSRVEADQSEESGRAKPDGTSGPVPTGDAVGFEPTASVKPVGSVPTSRVQPDQSSRVPAPAQMESLRDSYSVGSEDKTPFFPQYDEPRVTFQNGRLQLFNGLKQEWLVEFGGDEKLLNLALKQAAGFVQVNSMRPLEAQVSSQLARMRRDKLDKDERYAKAAKANTARKGGSSNRLPLEELRDAVGSVFDSQAPEVNPVTKRLTHER